MKRMGRVKLAFASLVIILTFNSLSLIFVKPQLPIIMTSANFTDANFTDANFTDANFTNANFTDANFTDLKLLHVPTASYMRLPAPNVSSPPVSFGACCGIGHRLSRNIPTMVSAISQSRLVLAAWTDIPWSILFNDTGNIKEGQRTKNDFYGNNFPRDWSASALAWHSKGTMPASGTSFDRYDKTTQRELFDMPLAHSIVKSLREGLSPLVLSFLAPIREQYSRSDLHLCTHVREGNNETGDWAGKTWRHLDLLPTLNATLGSMKSLATSRGAKKVSIFVASDNGSVRPWFEDHAPNGWSVVKPGKTIPRPDAGFFFGEFGSKTSSVLSSSQKNEAMAEAVADVFALGECDALLIPNYSSFSVVGIISMRAERRPVLFMDMVSLAYRPFLLPEQLNQTFEDGMKLLH